MDDGTRVIGTILNGCDLRTEDPAYVNGYNSYSGAKQSNCEPATRLVVFCQPLASRPMRAEPSLRPAWPEAGAYLDHATGRCR